MATNASRLNLLRERAKSAQPLQYFHIGELFAGAGGLALGAKKAHHKGFRLKHVWANDFDSDACKTFKKNFEGAESYVIHDDVKNINFSDLPKIDGLVFGFPCNDFSLIGKREGIRGRYGKLFKYGVEALEKHRPVFFLAENVAGLKSTNDKKDIFRIINSFENIGYKVYSETVHCENYDVPQIRHRQIFIGFDVECNIIFEMPHGNHRTITCKNALEDKKIPANAPNHESGRITERVQKRLESTKPGENAYNAQIPKEYQLNVISGAKFSNIYRRLDPSKPAYTITASGGGGTCGYHWEEARALTNRERARLQTFPDNFVFVGNMTSVRKQIGMAVPPKAAQLLFTAILESLYNSNIRPKSKNYNA